MRKKKSLIHLPMHHTSPRKNLHPSPHGKGKKEERKMLLRLQEKKKGKV
jgi:hypothetical protein